MEFKTDIELAWDNVILRPISMDAYDDLKEIATEESLWRFTPSKVTADGLKAYIQTGVDDWAAQRRMMFAIYSKAHGRVVGCTSIGNFDFKSRRAEIGWTWLGIAFQGIGLNSECKSLLLTFCFEELALNRVEFRTDVNNVKSRKALKKIGATEEGVLRQHTLLSNGTWRDTIYYSILSTEWENVKSLHFRKA